MIYFTSRRNARRNNNIINKKSIVEGRILGP